MKKNGPSPFNRREIASEVVTSYTSLLLSCKSELGIKVATAPLFRRYLREVLSRGVKPAWYHQTLLSSINNLRSQQLADVFLQPPNLFRMALFEDAEDDSDMGERRKEPIQNGGRLLVKTLLDEKDRSAWRGFLLYKDSFAVVGDIIETIMALETAGMYSDTASLQLLERQRMLFEAAFQRDNRKAFAFMNGYLRARSHISSEIQAGLDEMVMNGDWAASRIIADFDKALLASRGYFSPAHFKEEDQTLEYWLRQILERKVNHPQALSAASLISSTVGANMLAYPQITEAHVFKRFEQLFASNNILTEDGKAAVALAKLGIVPTPELMGNLLGKNYTPAELWQRVEAIRTWALSTSTVITPTLLEYLVNGQDAQNPFKELERLQELTIAGKFSIDNVLQQELEFGKFTKLVASHSAPASPRASPPKMEELYERFKSLALLPPLERDVGLSPGEFLEADRAAYEAAGFLRFLREFKARTKRPIVVVGNMRYGGLFVVEPISAYLEEDGVALRYFRVGSGEMRDRTTIPEPFSKAFIQQLSQQMPHIVVVDGSANEPEEQTTRFPSAMSGYANWFALFNDIRAQADISRYAQQSSLTTQHLTELRGSPQFISLRGELEAIIASGETYGVMQFAHRLGPSVFYGNVEAVCQPIGDAADRERPLVVLANPVIYSSEEELPRHLRGSHAAYWDDPEKYAHQKIIFGFAPFGVEARTERRDERTLVEIVQLAIRARVHDYMSK